MKNKMLLLAFAIVVVIIALVPVMDQDDDTKDFVIIHTGDTHGYIDGGD